MHFIVFLVLSIALVTYVFVIIYFLFRRHSLLLYAKILHNTRSTHFRVAILALFSPSHSSTYHLSHIYHALG